MTTSARNNDKVIAEKPNVPLFQRYISQGLRTHLQVILLLPPSGKEYSQSLFPPITIKCPAGGLKRKAIFSKSAPSSLARGMQLMASFRNLILVSLCSLRRSLFCIFFVRPLLQEQSRLFSSREFFFFSG